MVLPPSVTSFASLSGLLTLCFFPLEPCTSQSDKFFGTILFYSRILEARILGVSGREGVLTRQFSAETSCVILLIPPDCHDPSGSRAHLPLQFIPRFSSLIAEAPTLLAFRMHGSLRIQTTQEMLPCSWWDAQLCHVGLDP